METGEIVREPTAQETRAIGRVLDAQRRDGTEVREEVASEIRVEPAWVVACEREHAVHVVVPPQRNAAQGSHTRKASAEVIVFGRVEGAQPRLLQLREVR